MLTTACRARPNRMKWCERYEMSDIRNPVSRMSLHRAQGARLAESEDGAPRLRASRSPIRRTARGSSFVRRELTL